MEMKVSKRKGHSWSKNVQNVESIMEEDLVWLDKMCASNVENQDIGLKNA